jgi:hypothetical protein
VRLEEGESASVERVSTTDASLCRPVRLSAPERSKSAIPPWEVSGPAAAASNTGWLEDVQQQVRLWRPSRSSGGVRPRA